MSVIGRHKMSGTAIEETLMTATGMIDTKMTMGSVMSGTTGITPTIITHEGSITTSMKTGPDRVIRTKGSLTKTERKKGGPPTGAGKGYTKYPTGPIPSTYNRISTGCWSKKQNLATHGKHTTTIAGKTDIIVTNVRLKVARNDRQLIWW